MVSRNDVLYNDTIHKLLAVYRYLRQYGRRMSDEGVSGRKLSTMRYLLEAGPLTIGQIRDYLYINDSSTSELIARMEEKGYVTRTRSQVDNRVVIVDLTPAGRELAKGTQLGGVPLLREVLGTLPAERLALINEAMTDLIGLLEIQNGC